MYSKLQVGKYYRGMNIDETFYYFKVIDVSNDYYRVLVYKDFDSSTRFDDNRMYNIRKSRMYIADSRVTELTKDKLLAMII